jgi:hypothetical protein
MAGVSPPQQIKDRFKMAATNLPQRLHVAERSVYVDSFTTMRLGMFLFQSKRFDVE